MSAINPTDRKKDIQILAKTSGGVFIAARIALDFVAFGRFPASKAAQC